MSDHATAIAPVGCAGGTELPLVSVVVPTYRREEPLCNTIRGLLEQDYPRMEIIVVDQSDRHEPETEAFLRAHADRIRYMRVERPSLPNARNVGAREAKGDIIVFVDDDVIPSASLVLAHAEAYADPDVGCVAGQILPPDRTVACTSAVGTIDTAMTIVRNFNSEIRTDVSHAPGGNLSVRRSVFLQVGGFDSAFGFHALREETDFSLRVLRSGRRLVFEPRASLLHLAVPTGGCGNRSKRTFNGTLRWYYWFLHNCYLLGFRHRDQFDLTAVLLSPVRQTVRSARGIPLLGLCFPAAVHALISWGRSRSSIPMIGRERAMP